MNGFERLDTHALAACQRERVLETQSVGETDMEEMLGDTPSRDGFVAREQLAVRQRRDAVDAIPQGAQPGNGSLGQAPTRIVRCLSDDRRLPRPGCGPRLRWSSR